MTVRGQCFFVFNVSRRRRPDAYAIDAAPRAALDAVADAERDYLKKSTEARKNVLVARATLRGLAAATNATSAENATAVIEESGLGAKVKKLVPFAGGPKSNRDDALNALADATKEQQVAELDYLGVVASHLPDDVARRRLGQLAAEGRDGTLEGSLTDALSFLRNSTELCGNQPVCRVH